MNWVWWVLLAAVFVAMLISLIVLEYRGKQRKAAMRRHPAGKDLDNGKGLPPWLT